MSEAQKNPILLNFLRVAALAGTILVGISKFLTAKPLVPNQYFSYYALGFIALAFCIMLFGFLPRAAARILRNPDLLVPLGLYITAHEILNLFARPFSFVGFNEGKIDLAGLTFFSAGWSLFQFAIAVAFLGWTTRLLLGLVQNGKVDLLDPFENIRTWFLRTAAIVLVAWIPGFVFLALLLLPILKLQRFGSIFAALVVFCFVLAIASLLWNLATAALLPYVLSTKVNLLRAVREGLSIGWANKRKTILPVILLMVLSGSIVFLSVHYTEYETSDAAFGTGSLTTEKENFKWKIKSHLVWVGTYPSASNWHSDLMEMVEQAPIPSVDFRILLLLLVFSLAANLQIVFALPKAVEDPLDLGESVDRPRFLPGIALFAVLLVLVVPFEYLFGATGSAILDAKGVPVELVVPKIYTGEGVFDRTELFRYEKTAEEKAVPYLTAVIDGENPKKYEPDPDEMELNEIEQLYVGEVDDEPGPDILAAGSSKAFVLTLEGKVKKVIDFHLGKYPYGQGWQDRQMTTVEIVDFDGDGRPEIVGFGSGVCEIIDLAGKVIWWYPVRKGDPLSDVRSVAVGDVDNDGSNEVIVTKHDRLEVFGRDERMRWSANITDYSFSEIVVADLDQAGQREIVVDRLVFDGQGEFIRKINTPVRINGAVRTEFGSTEFMFFDQNRLGLFQRGHLVAKYDAPLSVIPSVKSREDSLGFGTRVFHAAACYVRFRPNEKKYLAVLADASDDDIYGFFKMLYIYDSEGKLIYHETIRAFSSQMTVQRNENGAESLLVTDDGKLLKYSIH